MAFFTEAASMAMRDALIGAYAPESIDRSFSDRVLELFMAGTLSREDAERLMKAPSVKREPRRTLMTERQLLDVIDRAIDEFRHVEGSYDGVDWMQLDREHDVASFALIRPGRPIRDPGPVRYLCKCGWPLELYFDQTLPCATCSTQENATVMVGRGQPPGEIYYLSLQIVFRRNPEARRWDPQPCIDRYVDTRLTEMLEDAGLGRALRPIEPIDFPAPPPVLRTFVEKLKDEITGTFANVPVGAGRKIGGMETEQAAMVPPLALPWPAVVPGMEFRHKSTGRIAKTIRPRKHKDRSGLWDTTDGMWWVGDPKEAHHFEFIDTDPRWETTPANYAWVCTQDRHGASCLAAAEHALFNRDEAGYVTGGAGACAACWDAGKRAPLSFQMSFASPEWTVNREAQHQRDLAAARASGAKIAAEAKVVAAEPKETEQPPKEEVAGEPALLCHLGLTCPIHYPKKTEPYVPTVTDWDLLPDVIPDAFRVRR